MRYVIPDDYDSFRCIAGLCPDTCCRGWQISIDQDSLEKYAKMPGLIGNRLRNSIDWRNHTFLLYEGICAMQGEDGLCDLQLEAGEEALCDTCRLYPRHEEEFDHVRERSLSLSCPEAARMAVAREAPLRFTEWETEEEDDFGEFDGVLFDRLRELRSIMICIAQDRDLPLRERLGRIDRLGRQAQSALEEGRLGEAGGLPAAERKAETGDLPAPETAILREGFSLLRDLPVRDERWKDMLDRTWEKLCSAEDDLRLLTWEWMEKYGTAGEQILVQVLYVYLCGAVYDRKISAKSSLAVCSVYWIFLIGAGNALADPPRDEKKLLTEVTWRLARSIEHYDENLERLEILPDIVSPK